MEIILKNIKDTQKLAEKLAKKWPKDFGRSILMLTEKGPLIIALHGDLGSGKTTFLQFFARSLGVQEKVLSPSFLIMKTFKLPKKVRCFKFLTHIDTYRIRHAKELLNLGLKNVLSDKENIVAIEWPEKISRYIPKNTRHMYFKVINEHEREVIIED